MSEIERAIEFTKKNISMCERFEVFRRENGLCPDTALEIQQTILQTLEGKQQREWIPVSERLPEAHVDVLMITDKGEYVIGYWVSKGDHSWWAHSVGKWIDFDEAPYWMPLPEPHKEAEM